MHDLSKMQLWNRAYDPQITQLLPASSAIPRWIDVTITQLYTITIMTVTQLMWLYLLFCIYLISANPEKIKGVNLQTTTPSK